MSETNPSQLFITATRERYRFPSTTGQLSVEGLWSLPVKARRSNNPSLDQVYRTLVGQRTENAEVSLVANDSVDQDLENKIAIVQYVYSVKTAETQAKRQANERRQQVEQLKEILAAKENEALAQLSADELRAKIAALS